MKLCDNCLEPAVDANGRAMQPFPVGHERGSQRDPYHVSIDLCLSCSAALGGSLGQELPVDLATFHERFTHRRQVERDAVAGG